MRELHVDVFDDPACPWCLVGLKRLDNAIATLSGDVAVTIVHHPFLLDPEASEQGEDTVKMLTRKYGRPPFDAWDRLETEAKSAGLELDMRKQKLRFWSQPALTLVAAAAEKGTQHELAVALGRANYLDAKNIADLDVLADIASGHGFTTAEAHAIAGDRDRYGGIAAHTQEAARQGITGVPFFIFAGRYALSGAQPQQVFAETLSLALDEAA